MWSIRRDARPVIDFGILPYDEARAYCDEYAASVPARVEWMRAELGGTGGPVDASSAAATG